MLIDVMIIDDDNDIHEYLKEIIDWEGLGLRLACEANDSITASEMFMLYSPKIIFIDICISSMTGITGLDLAREFYKQDSNVKIIIITGYTDFEYAKEAISISVIELLQKPLCPKEVKLSLIKAISIFEEERNKYFAQSAIKQIISKNIEVLRGSRIKDLFYSGITSNEKEIIEQFKQLSIDIVSKKYVVVKIQQKHEALNTNKDLHFMVIKNYIEAKLSKNGFKFSICIMDSTVLDCLVGWSEKDGEDILESLVDKLYEESYLNLKINLKIGIGGTVDSLTKIRISALEAEQCLICGNFETEPIVNFINVKTLGKDENTIIQNNSIEKIEEYLKEFDYECVAAIVSETFDNCNGEVYSLEDLRRFSVDYLLLLSKVCIGVKAQLWDTAEFSRVMKQVFSTFDSNILKLSLLSLTYEVLSHIKKRISMRNEQKNQLVVMAKAYVKEHLTEKTLGFDEVCNYIGLSKIYFGRLFHKEEQMSFSNYINLERIWHSKDLLVKTNLKVNDVAIKSGFANPKYFSVVFKSTVGITPLEFRRTKRLNL